MKWLLLLLAGCGPIGEAAPDGPPAGTPGTLQLAFTTTARGAQYTPLNCNVVWIERAGSLIKTIDRKCGVRAMHLIAWNIASGGAGADTDAVTGASRLSHADPIAVTWDLTDRLGAIAPDGTLTIRIENTEANATTAAQNNQGTFTFEKGPAVDTRSGLSADGFENVSFTFTPP